MARNKKQRESAAAPKGAKPAGTRMGTTEDWRVGGGKFHEKSRRGKTLRDGR